MKIALFHNYYRQPGGEDVLFEMELKALAEGGHEVVSFSLHSGEEIDGGSLVRKAGVAWNAAFNNSSKARLAAFLADERPDVGHVHNWFPLFSPSIYAAHAEAGIPVVQTLHNYRLGCAVGTFRREGANCHACSPLQSAAAVRHRCYQGSLIGSLAWKRMVDRNWRDGTFKEAVDAYICPSEEVARQHTRMGLPPEKLRIVSNACEDSVGIHNPATPPNLGRFLFLGRLVAEKGVAVLLQAWERLVAASCAPAPELEILGSGPDAAALKARFGHLPGVHFGGQVSRAAVAEALARTGTLVFPSTWAEPFGLGVIEAMAAGRPVIASNLGGPSELVTDGVDGCLVPADDPAALCEAMRGCMADPAKLQTMGAAARASYRRRFTPQVHAERLLEIYRSVIAGKSNLHYPANLAPEGKVS